MNELDHLAVIMDGNGRWAKEQNKERFFGHKEGALNVRSITRHASDMGIKYLTLYAFSTENWTRPQHEVTLLMNLLENFLESEIEMLKKSNIRFEVIGDISRFSSSLQKAIAYTKEYTKECSGMTQVIAINYGGQDEIIRAANKALKDNQEITHKTLERYLDTANMPSVDLLIRTGGKHRLSNFLLWQSAYAELCFTDTYWPDFSGRELDIIIANYKKSHRNFGGL